MKKKYIVKWKNTSECYTHENIFGKKVYKKFSHRLDDISEAWEYGRQVAIKDPHCEPYLRTKTVYYFKVFGLEIPFFWFSEQYVYGTNLVWPEKK